MTSIDLYYTLRSPYCYLAAMQLSALVRDYVLAVQLKPVYPLAISEPLFFKNANPLLSAYIRHDSARIARRLGIPFARPRPDPVVQDMQTLAVAAEQPYIRRLTHLAQLAAEKNRGLEFVTQVSALLYNPDVSDWHLGDHLAQAVARCGLDLADLDQQALAQADRLEAAVLANRRAQLAAGHWGAPLFVTTDGEIFFGQDRMDDLLWHLQRQGLARRA